jgi:ClpP class serine protease
LDSDQCLAKFFLARQEAARPILYEYASAVADVDREERVQRMGRRQSNANDLIERQLDEHAKRLETILDKDVLGVFGSLFFGADTVIKDAVEQRAKKHKGLAVVLETGGGFVEVVQRIVDTLRYHYEVVDFIIPDYAMSAGTVLAMSGDAIHMNYFSVLGPIDPQVPKSDGQGSLPALGYLEQYQRMIEKDKNGELSTVEAAFFVTKFDPAELYSFEQAKNLSISLLKEWLVRYKFKNWTVTETRGIPVTEEMKKTRAGEIGDRLNDTHRWYSHGRGISMHVLTEEIKLIIDDFGSQGDRCDRISAYHTLMRDYMVRRGTRGAIHAKGFYSEWM